MLWMAAVRGQVLMCVGLVYKSVWMLFPSSITIVSRKDTSCVEVSAVNLMEG